MKKLAPISQFTNQIDLQNHNIHTYKIPRFINQPNRTKSSKHFGHLACQNPLPSFNVTKWKPTCSPFAFTLGPSAV